MPTIRLPASVAGLKGESLTVRSWTVGVGGALVAGTAVVELEGDEAFVRVEASEAGVLDKMLAGVGTTVALGAALGEYTAKLGEYTAKPGAVAAKPAAPAVFSAPAVAATPAAAPTPSAATPTPIPPAAASGGAGNAAGVVVLPMPQASNTMEEGTVVKWYVKVGDRVTTGQTIYEVETDKATVDVEAPAAGRLAKIVADVGAVVPVKSAVGYLAENDADVVAFLGAGGGGSGTTEARRHGGEEKAVVAGSGGAVEQAVGQAVVMTGDRVKASPAARRFASTLQVELAAVGVGSGPEGRVLSTDVERAAKAGTAKLGAKPAASGAGGVIRRPMSKMRRAIAHNLQTSKSTVPHFYLRAGIEADALLTFTKSQKAATGCTVNDVVLLAVGKTVGEFPAFRSRADGTDIVEWPGANIGVAVSVEDGLVVPVVMGVEKHTLATLAAETKRIVEGARAGRLEGVGKGVFSISNMGMLGVEEFTAIINPPESGILAIAGARETVLVKGGAMKAAKVMNLTLSVDHRVVDGALAAAFMTSLRAKLEEPEKWLK